MPVGGGEVLAVNPDGLARIAKLDTSPRILAGKSSAD